jgi:hypothetical protein
MVLEIPEVRLRVTATWPGAAAAPPAETRRWLHGANEQPWRSIGASRSLATMTDG